MSYWANPEIDAPVYDFVDLDKIGSPVWLKILDWDNVLSLTFQNSQGQPFTSDYIETDKGLLRIDSKRLKKEMKPFYKKKGTLVIQRWIEGRDNRSAVFKVEFEPAIVSKKKPATSKK